MTAVRYMEPFLQVLAANAGSYGGHFMRRMIEGVFGDNNGG